MSKKIVRQCGKCGEVKGYRRESITRDLPHMGLSWLGDVVPCDAPVARCPCGSKDLRVAK